MESFEAIIIGAGQAGPSLAARFAGAGKKTAIVERHKYGGTCVNTGCIPTKTLVASARAAWVARRAADWGVSIEGSIRVDMKKVKERKDGVVRQSYEGLEKWLKGTANLTVIDGHARFENSHTIAVDGRRLSAPLIFINVGGRAVIPSIPGLDQIPYLTNSTMMDIDFLPEHLVVIGGSYIALEFAQMYRRFGSQVTVIERSDRILMREDRDVSEAVTQFLTEEGIRILTNTQVLRAAASCTIETASGAVTGSHLLVATGRVPNTHDLGLEDTEVTRDKRGYILVDNELETEAAGVYALGDCHGRGGFTHTSYNDYEIVAANLLDGDHRSLGDRFPCYAVYTDPPLGRAGMTETDVRNAGRKALIGKRPMSRVGRAVEKGETKGFLKVLVDSETKAILGASLLGAECDEAVHCLIDVMNARQPYTAISRAVHIHPTVSELLPTVLQNLQPLE